MSLIGRLEDLPLSDIFQILSIGKKTGTLVIKGEDGSALIIFKNGLVSRAESDREEKKIGEDLLESGAIKNRKTLDMALEVKKTLPRKSIAEILFEMGAVSDDTIEKFTRKRIERVIFKILNWHDGEFQFELDDLRVNGKVDIDDYGWELSRGMSPEYLLMEGARVHDEAASGMFSPKDELEEAFGGTVADSPHDGEPDEAAGDWGGDWGDERPAQRKDITSLKALTQELRFPSSASEITLLILRFASEIFQRGVFFMVGDDEILGLGQFGLDIDDADKKIRQIRLLRKDSPFMNRIVTEGHCYKGPIEKDAVTESMMNEIGDHWPKEAMLFPVIADDKVVALLYGDFVGGEGEVESEGLEIFISQAGLALEKALLKRRLMDIEG